MIWWSNQACLNGQYLNDDQQNLQFGKQGTQYGALRKSSQISYTEIQSSIDLPTKEGISTRASISVARNNRLINLRCSLITRIRKAGWQRSGTTTFTISESIAKPFTHTGAIATADRQD